MPKMESKIDVSAEGDMTSMIDMTFQLIAFFMILINFADAEANQDIKLPASQLAELKFSSAPTRIQRFMRERAVTINAQVLTGWNNAAVTSAVKQQLDGFDWPRGYRYELGGEAEASSNAFSGIGVAILVVVTYAIHAEAK